MMKKGTARVPGKGSEDSVPAMLTPGEAVLTRGAAEILGRDTINQLNAMAAAGKGSAPGHYADGTSNVDPTAIKPGPQSHFPGQGTIFTKPPGTEHTLGYGVNLDEAWKAIRGAVQHYAGGGGAEAEPRGYANGTSAVGGDQNAIQQILQQIASQRGNSSGGQPGGQPGVAQVTPGGQAPGWYDSTKSQPVQRPPDSMPGRTSQYADLSSQFYGGGA